MRQLILLSLLLGTFLSYGQDIKLSNPSFEGKPQLGEHNLSAWNNIGSNRFPSTSPPDLHSAKTNVFGIKNIDPVDGKTFLSLVVREDCTFEAISQNLAEPLKKSQAYKFNIHLARSAEMISATMDSGMQLRPFNIPAVLRFIGLSEQDSVELLAVSKPIENEEWQAYEFHIQPKNDIEVLMIEAYYDSNSTRTYNGHILLDLISAVKPVSESPLTLVSKNDSITLYPLLKKGILYETLPLIDRSDKEAFSELEFLNNFYQKTIHAGIYWFLKKKDGNYFEKLIALHKKYKMKTVHIEHIQRAIPTKPNWRMRAAYNKSNQWQEELESFLIMNRVGIFNGLARNKKPRGFNFNK